MVGALTRNYGLVLALTLVGLLSGLCQQPLNEAWSAYLPHGGGRLLASLPSLAFGAATGFCLSVFSIFNNFQRLTFIALTAVAFLAAFLVATGVEFAVRVAGLWRTGENAGISPYSMACGGAVGGLIILGGAVILVRRKLAGLRVADLLCWALWGGLFGILGWMLAPSLGMTIWRLFYKAHITAFTPPPRVMAKQYTYIGTESFFCSLFTIWQAGIGLLLGVLMQGHRPKAQFARKETEKP